MLVQRTERRAQSGTIGVVEFERACADVSSDDLRTVLRARLAESRSKPVALAVLAFVHVRGHARDVQLACDAVRAHAADDVVAGAFEAALAALLARDESAIGGLGAALGAAPQPLRERFVRALEAAGGRDAAETLATWAEAHRDLRRSALARLGRLAAKLDQPHPPQIVAPVRRILESGEPDALPEAVLCAGKLEDALAIPALIALLEHFHAGVRIDAHWALRRITGLDLPPTPARWTAWYAEEETFWLDHALPTWEALASPDRGVRMKALGQVSKLRLRRHVVAGHLAPAVLHDDEAFAVLVARELGRLRSPLAREALLAALETGSGERAAAAGKALRAIEGLDLPDDAAAWRDALAAR